MRLATYFVGILLALMFFAPAETKADTLVASYYGPGFEGNITASGDILLPYYEYTAASPYLPFGTDLQVCYLYDCVIVTVTDRGPYVGGRDLDLSAIAADDLGLTAAGVDVVSVEIIDYDYDGSLWTET